MIKYICRIYESNFYFQLCNRVVDTLHCMTHLIKKKTEGVQRDEIVALVWEERSQLHFSLHNGLNLLLWLVSRNRRK